MSFDANDPKWTAYVLGELSDEDTAAVEAELESNDEAREYVESLGDTTALLVQELMAADDEPAPRLDDIQRQRVRRAAAAPGWRRRWPVIGAGLAAAAAAVMFVVVRPGGDDDRVQADDTGKLAVMTEPGEAVVGANTASSGLDPSYKRLAESQDEELARLEHTAEVRTNRPWRTAEQAGRNGTSYASDPAADGTVAVASSRRPVDPGFIAPDDHRPGLDNEEYDPIVDNDFVAIADDPLSTFSIDVDTASYSNMRRFLQADSLPPAGAVRTEELINYFDYAYAPPTGSEPFAVHVDAVEAPWAPKHRLVRIGLKGREIARASRPRHNLVFLIDVSGSMNDVNKLPLLQKAMNLLVDNLEPEDSIAIVTYAGNAGVVLDSTALSDKRAVKAAIDSLTPGGSTNGAQGIERAYQIATSTFARGGVNRVILATDGDFNVGPSSRDELVRMIENKAKSGVYLTVLGFGMGNLNDATLEQLADHGNGSYAYIDTLNEAKKVLVTDIAGTLVTIAEDVKIQVEFNPAEVASYRLIGYENRVMAHQDFNDDTKDAGEIGSGHTVTALYEIVPAAGGSASASKVDDLKYQTGRGNTTAAGTGEMLTVKLRYKEPGGDSSELIELAFSDAGATMAGADPGMSLAAAVAELGMLLRDSAHKGEASYAQALELAERAARVDPHGYRAELIELIRIASRVK